jgi:hypothetical protein
MLVRGNENSYIRRLWFWNQIPDRQRLMLLDMEDKSSWVLSGSMDSWSNPFLSLFDLAVFVRLPTEIRMRRIRARESARHGARILPASKGRLSGDYSNTSACLSAQDRDHLRRSSL